MSSGERTEFKRLRDGGAVTVFGVMKCAAEGCENEVPRKAKRYCSIECWRETEGQGDEKEDSTEETTTATPSR